MPIKETQKSFQLRPYGLFQTSLIAGVFFVFGVIFILWGFYQKKLNQPGSILLYVVGGILLVAGMIYLTIRLWKFYNGVLNEITIDIEGIRVHNRKNGLQQSIPWDKKPRLVVQDDENDNPSNITLTANDDSETIDISLDAYGNVFLLNHKLTEKIKSAVSKFKAEYRKSMKEPVD
ncbi:MAG: hypothetical protein ACFFDW_06525 [Candidatus Thorarchaeota archaeon]